MRKHLTEEARRELIEAQLDRCENPDLAKTILKMRMREEAARTTQTRIADAITAFSGDMKFVYLHAVIFAAWMIINTGRFGIKPFDPFPYGLLTMAVSLEAIFLSTFVLLSQNRMSAAADKRADLDLQINLLAEHEITKLLITVNNIAQHLGIHEVDEEEEELERAISPETVLNEIARKEGETKG